MIMEAKLTFNQDGLIPAVVQDVNTRTVLMVAWMNKESLKRTMETGETWFFSRSRQELWHKGGTSGNTQRVVRIAVDCDQDTLLVYVEQKGVACHTGNYSCFADTLWKAPEAGLPAPVEPSKILDQLYALINERREEKKEGSYTYYLFDKGQDKILKKVGEEAAETIIASKNNDLHEITYEMADLWYHCLVLLAYHGLKPGDILTELTQRRK